MNKRYIRNGLEYYMEVEAMGGEPYEYQMLQENRIRYLLPLQKTQIDQREYLSYSTAGVKPFWITMHKLWINGEQFRSLVDSLLKAMEELKRYFLMADNLVLETECLFLNLEKFQFQFLYVPGYQKDICQQLERLVEGLLGRMDYKDQEGMMLAYGLSRLLKEETTDLEEIQRYLSQSPASENSGEKENAPENFEKSWEKKAQPDRNRVQRPGEWEIPKDERISLEQSMSEDRPEPKKQKKKAGWKMVLCRILWVFLFLGIGGTLFHIYWYGILPWKRNTLIGLGICLFLDSILMILFGKKRRQEEEAEAVFTFPEESRGTASFSMNPDIEKSRMPMQEKNRLEEKRPEQSDRKEENTIPNAPAGGTMILTDEKSVCDIPRLIFAGEEKQETILLVHFPFTIGSYYTGVDYRMEKRQISRFHAAIRKEGDRFLIKDLQSTNGTFVNDKRLEGEEEREMVSGDRIRFADLSYRFTVME